MLHKEVNIVYQLVIANFQPIDKHIGRQITELITNITVLTLIVKKRLFLSLDLHYKMIQQ
ncbi:hypothetical protein D1631_14230 [Chryseobacterium nematophagum]|uniref:Uncharacterized protein n=1 Tax=Chryseobacterium nematophagum TaxID=2305228 RepID=A0A3M7TJA8_9FLAO|nr:hypothetical protein D1631_14230 [Chryseobacterium nematophagum]